MNALIFDMDRILINTDPLHFLSDHTILEKLGIAVPDQYLAQFAGRTNPAMWKAITAEFPTAKSLEEILNLQLSLKIKLLKKGDYPAIEGIRELLNELYIKDIPVAIASSSPSLFIKEVIKKLRLQKYITTWVSAENVEHEKPEPDIFLKVAELLGVAPEKCVVIDDTKNGVIAAKRAGMKCIGYKNANAEEQDLKKADIVVDSLHQVSLESMKKLFRKQEA